MCGAFRKQAADYGFILRYPAGKEAVTGIAHEPWHFRYVGFPHSMLMAEENLCLEEYILWLKQFPGRRHPLQRKVGGRNVVVGYLEARECLGRTLYVKPKERVWVSGNNVDGFVVTVYE